MKMGAGTKGAPRGSLAPDIDQHVGSRLRERRLLLGRTQRQIAAMLGVSSQQVHKYETGGDQLTAGSLCMVAQALDVEMTYFFQGLEEAEVPAQRHPLQPMLFDLAQSFNSLPSLRHQEVLCTLARVMAASEMAEDNGSD